MLLYAHIFDMLLLNIYLINNAEILKIFFKSASPPPFEDAKLRHDTL